MAASTRGKRMTTTPLFHETARQLWVDGVLSRETVNRLMVPLPPSSWKQSIRETALQQHREGFGYGIEGETPGLNARLDRLG